MIDQLITTARERLGIPQDVDAGRYANIVAMFNESVAQYGEKPAFSSLGRTLSYAELDELSARFAGWLQQHTELQPGDRIAIQLPNLIQYPVVLFGALRAGLVVVNTNPLYSARELEHQFRDAEVKALVVLANVADTAAKVLPKLDGVRHVIVTELADLHPAPKRQLINLAARYIKRMVPKYHIPGALRLTRVLREAPADYRPVNPSPEDMAVLQYTGGTTGLAKGAMLSHRNLVANTLQSDAMFDTYGMKPGEETLIAPLPLYHIYSFIVSMIMISSGNHSILIPNPRDLDSLIRDMSRYPLTAFCGLNTLFVALCNHDKFPSLDFSQLKMTVSGGMALTAGAAQRWEEITGSQIYEGYGLTETSPVVSVNPGNHNVLGTIGIPVPGTRVRILGEEDRELGVDEPGELCIQGPQVMLGYWRNEEATREVLDADGWLRSGDIAILREDGFLKIVDRKKDMISVSGFNVYPNELEDVISQHPDVRECAVIGVPDEHSGEAVMLFVVRRNPGLEAQALRDWCKERMTGYKVPKKIEFRDDLPKSNVGKVLRKDLREEVMREHR